MSDYEGIYKGPSDPLPDVTTVLELRAALARVERERDEAREHLHDASNALLVEESRADRAEVERDALRAQVKALTGERAIEAARDAIIESVDQHLAFNVNAYGKAWTGEREDTAFICTGAAPKALASARDAAAAKAPEQEGQR